MNEIPVLVSIHSSAHRDDDTEEPISLMTAGSLLLDEEKAEVTYQETLDESLPPQTVIVTVQDDIVTMRREGNYATQMVFARGQRYEGIYQTPFGTMDIAVFCTRLSYDLTEEGGEIFLVYQMDMNGQFAAMHQMHLEVTPTNG